MQGLFASITMNHKLMNTIFCDCYNPFLSVCLHVFVDLDLKFRTTSPRRFLIGPTPPPTSGTTSSTSSPSAGTSRLTRWRAPSTRTSTSGTRWDTRPTRGTSTEHGPVDWGRTGGGGGGGGGEGKGCVCVGGWTPTTMTWKVNPTAVMVGCDVFICKNIYVIM